MNSARIISSAISTLLLVSCSNPSILWREGQADKDGNAVHTIVIRNAGKLPDGWKIWFSKMPDGVEATEDSQADIFEYQANLHCITARENAERTADSIVVKYRGRSLQRHSWAPEGFNLQCSRKVTMLRTGYEFLPLEEDGDYWYEYNKSLLCTSAGPMDIIPSIKNRPCEGEKPNGWYRLHLGAEPYAEYNDEDGRFYAGTTLRQLEANFGDKLPEAVLEDWPDFQYRGFMLDVARNFTSKENLLKFIDLLARYKINYLHLHIADDEGWRLEIDGIPELTSVGAFHSLDGLTLQPSYDGCAEVG